MKIIDAHFHYNFANEYFGRIAVEAGHINTREHLLETFEKHNIVHGIVMGNNNIDTDLADFPSCLSYCVGVDQQALNGDQDASLARVEDHLQKKNCVGIKLYPGYSHIYVSDRKFDPYYLLAQKYDKPVAIHTGATASSNALLKYSHPLEMDEIAVRFPKVRFVMCHMGNPWLQDAGAVLEKNPNVTADLSGLLVGKLPLEFYEEHNTYLTFLRTWIEYVDDYSCFMYGTDWPLVSIPAYIDFIARVVPEKYHEMIYFENANRIYQLGL